MRCALVVGVVMLAPAVVRADIMPPHVKPAKEMVLVEAEVPPGQALVVVNTWRGIDIVLPGVPMPISGSPRDGAMFLKLISAADLPAQPQPRRGQDGFDRVLAVRSLGQACSGSFTGYRYFPERTAADSVTWVFDVTITGTTCDGVLRAQEFRDRAGALVEPGDLSVTMDGAWNAGTEPARAKDAKDVLAIPEPAKVVPREAKQFPTPREVIRMLPPPGDTPAALRPHGCGCASGADAGAPWWALLLVAGGRRSRLSQGTHRLPRRQA